MFILVCTSGSSSVGSVNAKFLAAFSAATGKRSVQSSETQETDPDVRNSGIAYLTAYEVLSISIWIQ